MFHLLYSLELEFCLTLRARSRALKIALRRKKFANLILANALQSVTLAGFNVDCDDLRADSRLIGSRCCCC